MLDRCARVLLAAVFLAVFIEKVRPQGFAEFHDSLAALVPLPARELAVVVLAGEAVAVVLLAVPGTRLGYGVVVTLPAAFCGGIVLAMTSRKSLRCKCFGAGGDVLGPRHLVRNGSLIAVAAFVPAPVSWEEPLTLLTIAVLLLAVVVVHVLFTYGLVARDRELQENAGPCPLWTEIRVIPRRRRGWSRRSAGWGGWPWSVPMIRCRRRSR
ncbi:hypothetical protein SAMN04488564_101871 [Lentzea waywayandensis]|uniref:Methylamine utilisation protein MauE domain-containing protein n=1 Tax=Lentzea waywayandensis TaxID=84724 RepID=A0A1I6D2I6_9PSEU|nr:hypothetical protein SAMN04488564_101871 [Lentzea waywayandensis]